MTGRLLAELGARAAGGDVVVTVDDTVTVVRDPDGGLDLRVSESSETQIRAFDHGRLGWAGGESRFADDILAAALRSVAVGEAVRMFMPAPSPVAEVVTRSPATGAMSVRDLVELVAVVSDRLRGVGACFEVVGERSVGSVEVGNTRGVSVEYQTSTAAVQARVWLEGGPREPLESHLTQVGPIEPHQIDELVAEIERAAVPAIEVDSIPRVARVWFGPRAVRALLAPVLVRLAGDEWFQSERDWPPLDSRLTLVDDPLAPGRPGSRPIDDDGVVTQPTTLIDGGNAIRGIFDLEVGARRSVPSTGHAWRRGFTPPRIGFSNIVLTNGGAAPAELAQSAEGGLWVRSFRFGPAPNPITGTFRIGVPWAYRVEQGSVVGRIDGLVLSGNVFELLKEVVAVGNDGQWIGSAAVPSIVVDGVGCERR